MTTATQQTAAAANESRYASGVSRDFCEADALDPEYLDTDEAEDVDGMTTAQRQALNARMADYFNG